MILLLITHLRNTFVYYLFKECIIYLQLKNDIMEYNEYEDKLRLLKKEHEEKRMQLIKEYVDSNNPYKIGDVVTDHVCSIIIEKIKYHISLQGTPSAVYYGSELKKDGTPKKNGNKTYVYQINLKQ